jgi:electron transfer flavoprotein beta subunit
MPVVLTVVKEIACPRLPTLRGKQRAKKTDIPTWGPETIEAKDEWLGLHGSPTRVVKIDKPSVARQGELIHAKDPEGVEEAASRIIDYLRDQRFIKS